ncbi:SRPBCC domain-containing protein [Sporosarcina siberiensis]|uniref:SRPBCC domain-containing protein n=1 Tax=Sporosarcina siberiensis TaxID=1365606 RepID=A0ABW4SKQ6_9BACL
MSNVSTTTLIMTRTFDVAPKSVFDAWLNTEMMRKWLFTLEETNKVTQNKPQVGGTWEIVDHREGKDYRATGEYLEIVPSHKLAFTFTMPQFNELEDTITVELKELQQGCEMTFTHLIHVPQEENWSESGLEKALSEHRANNEWGWDLMFMGLKELVETGYITWPNSGNND